MRFLIFVALALCCSCAAETPADPERGGQMVYIDTATEQPFVANISREFPALHPDSGERTLIPALYCPTCQKWYPAPPVEVLQRNPAAAKCPKSGDFMTANGPWPTAPAK